MECKYFGVCGSCRVYADGYEAQLEEKLELNRQRFQAFYNGKIAVFKSSESHYRSRSEFKIWHIGETIHYAMNHLEHKGALIIEACPQVNRHIFQVMPLLLEALQKENLGFKLFGADFLSASSGEMVVSLLYHRSLDEEWKAKSTKIAHALGISIIGRSRKQKIVIGQDFVTESLNIGNKIYKFNYIENSFTQPNASVNEQMITWALNNLSHIEGDLLELYCGAGNFTIPLAQKFRKVLATEISKSSINAAKTNMDLNDVQNIEFVRMSVEEFVEALDGVREFKRMSEIHVEDYEINAIFVDPPRSGMDEKSSLFAARHTHILYISCNPETLLRDLELLCKTHEVVEMALFDQFPYTHHVEMGVKLVRK